MLKMANPQSAATNIFRPLRQLGIINDDGGLTERGNKWRVDSAYADACQEMLDEVYPRDLAALTGDDGAPDKEQIHTWLEHRGYGGSNARQMAATYVMIAEKRLPEPPSADSKNESTRSERRGRQANRGRSSPPPASERVDGRAPGERAGFGPTVHLDIQIHIPAAATPEQVDQIFASMAKHLYGR